jgi:hypothetical protein
MDLMICGRMSFPPLAITDMPMAICSGVTATA